MKPPALALKGVARGWPPWTGPRHRRQLAGGGLGTRLPRASVEARCGPPCGLSPAGAHDGPTPAVPPPSRGLKPHPLCLVQRCSVVGHVDRPVCSLSHPGEPLELAWTPMQTVCQGFFLSLRNFFRRSGKSSPRSGACLPHEGWGNRGPARREASSTVQVGPRGQQLTLAGVMPRHWMPLYRDYDALALMLNKRFLTPVPVLPPLFSPVLSASAPTARTAEAEAAGPEGWVRRRATASPDPHPLNINTKRPARSASGSLRCRHKHCPGASGPRTGSTRSGLG